MGKRLKIIGHRGAMGLAPENSIEAIRIAIENDVDEIEIDARVQSGVVVLSHDKVKTINVYCPLKQALKEVNGQIPINLEIKTAAVIKHLPKLLHDYRGEIVFSSFKFTILQKLKKVMPEADIALIEKWSGVRAVAEATLLGTKRIHMNERWLWANFVQSIANEGFELYAYTVNEEDRAKELLSWGVKGIFTDYPDRFVR